MGKFSQEDINRILNLRSVDGSLIDIFELHGVLYIGNTRTVNVPRKGVLERARIWDLTKTHQKYSEHSIAMNIGDFELCETEDDVRDTFAECLGEAIKDNFV